MRGPFLNYFRIYAPLARNNEARLSSPPGDTPPSLRHEIAHTETFSAKVNGIPLNVEEINL
jgi:hypothetical protein